MHVGKMEVLIKAHGEIYYLTDFIKQLIIVDESELDFLNKFKDVLIYVDETNKKKCNNINQNCTGEWNDYKNALYTSKFPFGLTKSIMPTVTNIFYHRSQFYSSGTNLFNLLDNTIWKELYYLIGTSLMNLILNCSLYLPLDCNSFIVLHEERALRVLNGVTKTFTPLNNHLKDKRTVTFDLKHKKSVNYQNSKQDSLHKKINSAYGFDGSLLLSLDSLMYNRSAVKYRFWSADCNCVNSGDVYENMCKNLQLSILEENVGVNMDYTNVDLSNFMKMLKDFIYKNCENKNCKKIIKLLLDIKHPDHLIACNNKRKLSVENFDAVKKIKISETEDPVVKSFESEHPVTKIRKSNRWLHNKKKLKLRSLYPISLSIIRKHLTSILRKVLTKDWFGGQQTFVIKQLLFILKYGKNQVFELRELLMNINVKKIPFLQNVKHSGLKWNLLAKFIKWLLNKYIFAVISDKFYVTETRGSFNKLQYLKKKDWQFLSYCTINKFRKSGRWRIVTKSILKQQNCLNLRPCQLRFIPKGRFNVRPIVWKTGKDKLLTYTQIFLSQLCLLNTGSRKLNNLNELHKLWLSCIKNWKPASLYPLYFVKVDISDAYGSIIVKKLLDLLSHVITKAMIFKTKNSDGITTSKKILKQFTLRKIKCFRKNCGTVSCRYLYRFDELPSNIPSNVVIVPTKNVEMIQMKHLFNCIRREILFKDVRIGSKRFLITKGIAQGDHLSSVLCQMYYDYVDHCFLLKYVNKNEDLLVRAVDDYFYATPNLDRAKAFLERMEEGFDEFGCFINKKKTITNFGENSSNLIPYYGLLFDTKSMEIFGNYEFYKGVNVFHTLSFRSRDHPGKFLKSRMTGLSTLKLQTILLDPVINNKKTILLNVMKASLLMAFRFHAIVVNMLTSYNSDFLNQCITIFARLVSSRIIKVSKKCDLPGHNIQEKIKMATFNLQN
ncbi:telomerase reverse transcriptase-like isoform X2 [Lycorma delicatula]|uniref:telomerase reverse transcriptase-like isoform X2 n=1 Tax=Lycorma delicatula TaxID=130591 RepID=UPI003F5160D4